MIKAEKTFVMIKPDGVQRSLIGEVVQRFERIGLKLVAIKMVVPTEGLSERHYTVDPEWLKKVGDKAIASYTKKGIKPPSDNPIEIGKKVLGNLVKYLTSGPVITMVWQGAHAVSIVKKLVGGTEPLTSDVGTIRGDFVLDSYQMADVDDRAVRNLIHVSTSPEEAKAEIDLWFKDGDLIKYNHIQDKVLYDVNLDGILE